MVLSNLSAIGWIHMLASVLALVAGAAALAALKGTREHDWRGQIYVYALIASCLTAFGIYSTASFGVFHWMAVATLVVVGVGRMAASRQAIGRWAYVHPAAMILSYYSVVGGALNEAFVRIDGFRELGWPVLGIAQAVLAVIFLVLLAFVLGHVAGRRSRVSDAASTLA
jgi:uncharacterized membrane protein